MRFRGKAKVEVSGLVVGVGIGVISTDPGGDGEQLGAGVELHGISSRQVEAVEMFKVEFCVDSSLPFSTP